MESLDADSCRSSPNSWDEDAGGLKLYPWKVDYILTFMSRKSSPSLIKSNVWETGAEQSVMNWSDAKTDVVSGWYIKHLLKYPTCSLDRTTLVVTQAYKIHKLTSAWVLRQSAPEQAFRNSLHVMSRVLANQPCPSGSSTTTARSKRPPIWRFHDDFAKRLEF